MSQADKILIDQDRSSGRHGQGGALPSARELIDTCDKLFFLPELSVRVRDVVDDPSSSLDDLAKVLVSAQAITARSLQVVHSPLYGLPRKVGSMSEVIGLLGMHPDQELVLATSVATASPNIAASVLNMTD